MKRSRIVLSFSLVCLSLSAVASTWIEGSGNVGDASAVRPGQNTIGDSGSLTSIQGRFEFDDVDVYKIRITNPANFRATTVGLAGFIDTQLFLFNENGMGVTHNDDDPATNAIQSTITGQFVPGPGIYYLAITQYNRDSLSAANRFQWNNTPFNVERAPDGNGATEVWTKWSIEALLDGEYEIGLVGADFAEVGPTPPAPQENIWVETSDAPALLPGQITYGEGLVVRIDGVLTTFDDVDVFKLNIFDPAQFRASTVGLIDFDSQLYLFDESGKGITFNDDDPGITGSWSIISGVHVPAPGTYYLAITKWDKDPTSVSGAIWMDEPTTVERAADGPGAANPLTSWDLGGVGRTGDYSILVRGAKFSAEGFTLAPVSSYNRIRGTAVSGGLSEMSQSDDLYAVFGPGAVFSTAQDPIVIEFFAALPTGTPSSLELLVESRGTSASIRQLVQVYDFVAQQYVTVNSQNLQTSPDVVLAIDISAVPNVIGPDNKVRALISYRTTGPVFSYPWRVSIDQVGWRLQTQ